MYSVQYYRKLVLEKKQGETKYEKKKSEEFNSPKWPHTQCLKYFE